MEKRQKQVVPSPSKSPAREYKKEIPADILIDIVSRLPLKDVARCRCVSKLWSCMLRRRDFTQLYLKVSSVRPRILFTFLYKGKRILYSLPQDLDPDQDYPIVYPHYQMQFPKGLGSSDEVCPSILGFICTKSRKPMICNPSTGQYISLPVTTTKRKQMSRPYFGYDPIGKVFKVLSVSDDYLCRVSTLGTGVVTWKRVECSIPHQPLHTEVCIHGVLYYLAKRMGRGTPPGYMVVCFDVESERFKFLDVELPILGSALINYKGNLGILLPDSGIIYEGTESFELRVLEDTDYEVKWSNNVYILPFYWKYAVSHSFLYIAGMTSAGEIVLSTSFLVEPFEVIYYNIVENTVVRMEISFGFVDKKAPPRSRVLTLVNHVENVELMD